MSILCLKSNDEEESFEHDGPSLTVTREQLKERFRYWFNYGS